MKLAAALCMLAHALPALAQPAAPPTGGVTTLSPYLRFDRVAGMAKGAVKAIAQDDTGFMWFGTDEGLSRYDGYEFVNYVPGPEQGDTLSSFVITSLAAGDGALWIGTLKGLDRLDLKSKKFTHYHASSKPNSIAADYIVSLHLGASGLLWIGTSDSGVDSLDVKTGEVHHYRSDDKRPDSLSDDEITVVHEAKDGKVWIGTRDAGLNLLDPHTGKAIHFLTDSGDRATLTSDKITSIYEDAHGTIWVGTLDGLNQYDPAHKSFKRFLQDPTDPKAVNAIVAGSDGGLWLGLHGVTRLDPQTGATEVYTHDGADPTTIVNPITWVAFADRGGVMWFGGDAGGVSKLALVQRQFTFYRTQPGLSFLEDGDRLWIGSLHSGLRELDLKTGAVTHYLDDVLDATWTMKIVPGDDGSLWLGTTDKGLLHFNPRTGSLVTYDAESGTLPFDAVFALVREGDVLWVGTFGGGLIRFDTRRRTVETFGNDASAPDSLSSDQVTALYQDLAHPDLLWVGTSNGLNAFDKRTHKAVRYLHDANKPTSLSHDHITDIHQDHSGRTWIATWGGGLDELDVKSGSFTGYHTKQGMPSEVVFGILEDKSGTLWLTTNDGLVRFDVAKSQMTTFRSGDGLQDDEFGQGAFHQGASGRFYVGGPNGFNVFVPESIQLDSYVPPIAITKLTVLGDPRPVPDKLALSYRERGFSITFAALAYAAPARNRYKVRLLGADDWIETDRRFVNYSSLSPGDYTLEVIGSNEHGVWADHGIKLAVHVPPPPWRTWWAFCLYGLVAVLIAGLFYRRHRGQIEALRRTHRLSELEREMALSSAVQEGFFPTERTLRDGVFGLEAFYRAAAQCGGDWWSYEAQGDNYFVVVGDATGHGVGSAMVTAAAASTFRSLGQAIDYDTRLQAMNDEVLRVSRGQYHMTLTAVELNLTTGQYVIRSAGGVPVFALAPNARPRVLMCPGTPLGSTDFEVGRLEGALTPGERLLILTDGVPEVALANQQILGPRGVANFYMQTREFDLGMALQQLMQKVEEVNASVQDDDWTVVMVQWGDPVVIERADPTTFVGGPSRIGAP